MFAYRFNFSSRAFVKLSFIGGRIPTRGAIDRTRKLVCVFTFLLASGLSCCASSACAQDWPQMLGPERSGQATQHSKPNVPWPEVATVAWQAEIGSGYAGPAVSGEQVLVLHRKGQKEMLESFDLTDGQSRWQTSWPASYRSSIDPDDGPRCVPTVAPAGDGDSNSSLAICYGAAGDLSAVDVQTGKLRWHRPLRSEYQADDGYFGAGSAPLVLGQRVIVCLGGKRAGIIAVDLETGKTLWTATDYDASYAAPIAIDPRTILVVTRLQTVLVDVATGQVLSEIRFGSRGPTVNAATPIAIGAERYLLTASYGVGMTILSTADRQLDELLRGSDLLSSQYATPVLSGGRLIGIDGRADVGVASLRSIDLEAQEIIWNQADFGTAHLIAIGPQVLTLTSSGRLALIDATADSYREVAHCQLPAGIYRAPPALVTNKLSSQLIVRDSPDDRSPSTILCIEL